MTSNSTTQVAVIGGGPGGYAAAFMAADLGLDVTLINLDLNPGGTCLYRGCIPSKALLHVTKLLHETHSAACGSDSAIQASEVGRNMMPVNRLTVSRRRMRFGNSTSLTTLTPSASR